MTDAADDGTNVPLVPLPSTLRRQLEQLAAELRACTGGRVLFITGAGVSAESGLPTYRGTGGLYNQTVTAAGLPIETVLSGTVMQTQPALTWKYLQAMEQAARGKQPNAAHIAIAQFEAFFTTIVLTQNIDGLHTQAGSAAVIEIHGSLYRLRCTAAACPWEATVANYAHLAPLPHCPRCDALMRPCVVLFGEMLPAAALEQLEQALAEPFAAVFIVGTTAVFPYIRAPLLAAQQADILTVEINPTPTELSAVCKYSLRAQAGAVLSALHAMLAAGEEQHEK